MFFLLVCLANLIVVGGHASNIIEDFSSFVCSHFCQTGNIALKDNIVTVWPCICCAEEAMEDFLTAQFTVQFVGGHGVV